MEEVTCIEASVANEANVLRLFRCEAGVRLPAA